MFLIQALRIDNNTRLALVGAGGKSTALFRLAEEFVGNKSGEGKTKRVLLTATTHLSAEQAQWADHHIILTAFDDFQKITNRLPSGSLLFTGPLENNGRLAGLNPEFTERIFDLAESKKLPLLVEADGSRQRPLKAPASHEPAVPEWINTCLIVAGLSGIGNPLNSKWVHRPERFAAISKQTIGSRITPSTIISVLKNKAGGLKGLPDQSRRICLLNQADNFSLRDQAQIISQQLLTDYDSIITARFIPLAEQPRQQPYKEEVFSVHEPASGILLAAGSADRMRNPKQILPLQGIPMVEMVARTALKSALTSLTVVTGAYRDQIHNALAGLEINFVHNPEWQTGMSSSLKKGLSAIAPNSGSAVFFLSDQPFIPEALVDKLIGLHAQTLDPIIAPFSEGKRGNPVLFDRVTFHDLLGISGDIGGRALFNDYPVTHLPWNDPKIFIDIDTPEDYKVIAASLIHNHTNGI